MHESNEVSILNLEELFGVSKVAWHPARFRKVPAQLGRGKTGATQACCYMVTRATRKNRKAVSARVLVPAATESTEAWRRALALVRAAVSAGHLLDGPPDTRTLAHAQTPNRGGAEAIDDVCAALSARRTGRHTLFRAREASIIYSHGSAPTCLVFLPSRLETRWVC